MTGRPPVAADARASWAGGLPDPTAEPEWYQGTALRRALGYLADAVVIAVLLGAAWMALSILSVLSLGLLFPVQILILALLPLAYHTLLIGGPRSATLGMRLAEVEVRRLDGGRPGLLQALVHTALFYLSVGLLTWLVLLVCLFNTQRRCLHDYLAGTVVLRTGPVVSVSG